MDSANPDQAPLSHAAQIPRLKRSGARRYGDEYQDVQSLDLLVQWLEHTDRYRWMQFEADQSGFLDDILVARTDGILEVWQVKFSTTSHRSDDAWTWEMLLKQDRGKPSLLQKWFNTWKGYVAKGIKILPGLLSNRRAAPELGLDSSSYGKVRWSTLAEDTQQKIVVQLGNEAEVRAFFENFHFRLDEPSLHELADGVRDRFERLGGTPTGWYNLENAVRQWVSTKDNPPPQGHIDLEEVRRVAQLKAHPLRLSIFLPPATFFAQYLKPDRIFHHCLPQVGRRTQLNELLAFKEGKHQIALLPGRGGSGKSKLLYTLCRRLARKFPSLTVRLVAENVPIHKTALEELPDDHCLVIVDDAHRAIGVEILLAAAQQNPALKVLLVTRPHGTNYLIAQAIKAGFESSDVVVTSPLLELGYPREHRRLAKLVLGHEWQRHVDELAYVTRDSPFLTVLGGQLLRTNQVAPSSLTQNSTFHHEVLSRFEDILFGEIITQLNPRFSPELCANVLPLIGVLSPLNLGDKALLQTVARLSGTDEVRLQKLLDVLVNAGALVRGGKFVRIVPDVLSDFIVHEECFTGNGIPTHWASQVYQEVSTLDNGLDVVLRNLAELDWRVRSISSTDHQSNEATPTSGEGLLDFIWQDIQQRFRTASLAGRKKWLNRLERIAFMQPHYIWPIIEIARYEPVTEEPEASDPFIRQLFHTTQADVLKALVPVLEEVAHNGHFTERCADLLWEISHDEAGGYTTSAVKVLSQLASYANGKTLTFNHIILDRCRDWINDPQIHTYRHSILNVISPLLARRIHWGQPDNRWQSHGSFPLPEDPLHELRRGALELVERCALSGVRPVVLRSLRMLRPPIGEEGLWEWRDQEEPVMLSAFEGEQLEALRIVEQVAQSNEDPFVRLAIWEELHQQAEAGSQAKVRDRAREILQAIPLTFESRFILVINDMHEREQYHQTWGDIEDYKTGLATELDLDRERIQRSEAFARQVIREWAERYPDPHKGFDALDEWIEEIETSTWKTGYWTRNNSFSLQLVADVPEYARTLCEIASDKPDARFTMMCADILSALRRRDGVPALELVQRFLAQGHPNLWLCVAASYSWRGWPTDPFPEEWQIVPELLAFPNQAVRRSAAGIVADIASTDWRRAVEMILGCDIGEDDELADKLFKVFNERDGFNFDEITSDELSCLLDKLKLVESVHHHHLGQFLLQAVLRSPIDVAQFLLDYLKHKTLLNEERMKLPLDARSRANQVLDGFNSLPEAAFHDERFNEVVNHPDYRDTLRLLRDAALSEESRRGLLYGDTLSELFDSFSLNYGSVSLDVLNEWVDSGDCSKVRAVQHLLDDTYLGFYVDNTGFVSNYLRRARECGKAVFEEIERHMLHCAQYGPPRRIAGDSGEHNRTVLQVALNVLQSVQDDRFARNFFDKLREKSEALIANEMQQVAEINMRYRS